jgi:phosphoribosylformylglycinamidine synthase
LKFGVVIFAQTAISTYYALRDVHQETIFLWHKIATPGVDCVVLPGGFSYGDYLRSGAIARFSPLMQEVREFADRGGVVLGICNGFQVLLELGLLPGAMLRNKNLKFLCQYVHLRVDNAATRFTRRIPRGRLLRIPIAHFDGNNLAPAETLKEIEAGGQVVFRYVDEKDEATEAANVNGSARNIAGLINKRGNVLGMMPHPERASEALLGSEDGRLIFESLVHQ